MKKLINPRFGILIIMVLLAALSRLLPHPYNFTPIGAMALFGGAYFANRLVAILVPLLSLWVSDLLLNNIVYSEYYPSFTWFTPGGLWIYGSFVLIGVFGMVLLQKVSIRNVLISSLSSSVFFFLVTNFSVWLGSTMYPQTREGLLACYAAGLPFFQNTIMGDLFFSAVLFGAFELMQRRFPALSLRGNSQVVGG